MVKGKDIWDLAAACGEVYGDTNEFLTELEYRCAAHLSDGSFLPCVVVRNRSELRERLKKRLREGDTEKYDSILGNRATVVDPFLTRNYISPEDIVSLERSRHAIPLRVLGQVTEDLFSFPFIATMDDGCAFSFCTNWDMHFFEMPHGYHADRIDTVRSTSMKSISDPVYRQKNFSTCLVEE